MTDAENIRLADRGRMRVRTRSRERGLHGREDLPRDLLIASVVDDLQPNTFLDADRSVPEISPEEVAVGGAVHHRPRRRELAPDDRLGWLPGASPVADCSTLYTSLQRNRVVTHARCEEHHRRVAARDVVPHTRTYVRKRSGRKGPCAGYDSRPSGDWCNGNIGVSKTLARGSIPRSPA
jgi:hypothetical protein